LVAFFYVLKKDYICRKNKNITMAITSTSFKLFFRLDSAPKVFQVEDTTDYSLQGANNADIVGLITIVGPDGETYYTNTDVANPDVTKSTSDLNSTVISLPLLADGSVEPGQYVVTYRAVDTSDSSFSEVTKTVEFCYKSPSVSLDVTADCISPLLASTDTSNYIVDGVTPDVVRTHTINFPIGSNFTPISASTQRIQTDTFTTKTHTIVLDSTLTYDQGDDFCIVDLVRGTREIDVQCDATLCDLYCCLHNLYKRYKEAQGTNRTLAESLREKWVEAESIRSLIKDSYECGKETNVSDLVNDILKIGDCEPGCGCADGEEPTPILGVSTTEATPVPTTTFGSGGSGEANTASNLGTGEALFSQKSGVDLQFKSLVAGDNISMSSNGDQVTINAVALSSGTGSNTVVDNGDGISVSANISGSTTTYTVSMEAALYTKLNGLRNTEVTAGAGITVNETTGPGGEAIYEVESSAAAAAVTDSLSMMCRIEFSGSQIPQVEIINSKITGTKYQLPAFEFVNVLGEEQTIYGTWDASILGLFIKDFYSAGSGHQDDYLPTVTYHGAYKRGGAGTVVQEVAHSVSSQFLTIEHSEFRTTGRSIVSGSSELYIRFPRFSDGVFLRPKMI
jgi:hypothetical protein